MGSELTHNESRYTKKEGHEKALTDIFNQNRKQKAILNEIVKRLEEEMSKFSEGVCPAKLYNSLVTYKLEQGKREYNEGVFASVWKKQQRRHERREGRRG